MLTTKLAIRFRDSNESICYSAAFVNQEHTVVFNLTTVLRLGKTLSCRIDTAGASEKIPGNI